MFSRWCVEIKRQKHLSVTTHISSFFFFLIFILLSIYFIFICTCYCSSDEETDGEDAVALSGRRKKKLAVVVWRSKMAADLLHHPTLAPLVPEGTKKYGNINHTYIIIDHIIY